MEDRNVAQHRTGLDKTSGAQQMRCGHLSRCLPAFETCVADRLGADGEKGGECLAFGQNSAINGT